MYSDIWFTMLFGEWGWLIALAIAIGINVPIFVWVRIKRHLTLGACFLAGFFGIIYFMIGPFFYVLLFVFFISSSILTSYRKRDKKDIQDKFSKGGERDASQVLANGLAGLLFAVAHIFVLIFTDNIVISNAFVFAFIAAIATTNADTWATEIGILSKDQPFWILNLRKKVERGTSGGISIKGTGAALFGSFIVASIALIFEVFWRNPILESSSWQMFLFIPLAGVAGFLGAIIDSFFGAIIQGFFECSICGKGTEKKIHCGAETIILRGKDWFRNDHVNFFASLLAGIIAFALGCFGFLLI
ncbi:MAG: DUF92 domain-containing protein [Asgard group archaeon]|nr:DUF92 domain-containing protein [Asgard group archaeon]